MAISERTPVAADINIGTPISARFSAQVVDLSGVPPSDVVRASDDFRIDCS
jgi:hypothetical protein